MTTEAAEKPITAGSFVAAEYEARIEPFTGSFVDALLGPFLKDAIARQTSRLLDIGCGTGIVSLRARQEGFQVTATDMDESMIVRLQERALHQEPQQYAMECLVADGQSLPQTLYNRFDYCTAHFSVIFFPSPLQGLEQIHSCLVPGGRVVLSAWGNAEETPAFQVFPDAFQQVAPHVDYSTARITGSPPLLTSLLQEAGFDEILIVGPVSRTLKMDSAQAYFDRFALSSPKVRERLENLPRDTAERIEQTVKKLATERGGCPDGSIELVSNAYFAYGRKPE